MNLDRFPAHFSEGLPDDEYLDRREAALESMADIAREDSRLGQSCSVDERTMLRLLAEPHMMLPKGVERRKLNDQAHRLEADNEH